jgi:regulator of replication initiation timing
MEDYFKSTWNILDVFQIFLLLSALVIESTVVPLGYMTTYDTRFMHAFNLLPCYARLLQMLELTEMLGTLFLTFFDMYKDTLNFMILLVIVGFGFSCALTPMLLADPQTRWDHGFKHLFWTFWAIFGDVGETQETEKLAQSTMFAFMVQPLRYFLYLTLNVLLVNLLIAQMNDSYTENKEESKRNWGYHCLEAVLEYASEEVHSLPPPLDFGKSVTCIWNLLMQSDDNDETEENDDKKDDSQSKKVLPKLSLTKKEQQILKALQQKVINEESSESSKKDKDKDSDAQESRLQAQLKEAIDNSKLSMQLKQLGEVSSLKDEVAKLREENGSLRGENGKLKEENGKLKALYSVLSEKTTALINFIKNEKGESVAAKLDALTVVVPGETSVNGSQQEETSDGKDGSSAKVNGSQAGS